MCPFHGKGLYSYISSQSVCVFYLSERQSVYISLSHLLVHSSNSCNSWDWTSRSQELNLGLPSGCQQPNCFNHYCYQSLWWQEVGLWFRTWALQYERQHPNSPLITRPTDCSMFERITAADTWSTS